MFEQASCPSEFTQVASVGQSKATQSPASLGAVPHGQLEASPTPPAVQKGFKKRGGEGGGGGGE